MIEKNLKNVSFDEQKLTDLLVHNRVITQQEKEALHKAFANYDGDEFTEFLVDEGLVGETDLLNALAQYYMVPAVDVLGYLFYHDLLRMFPKEFLIANEIIPFTVDENIMIMVAADPDDPELLSKIGKHVSYDIQFCVGLARDIRDEVEEFYDTSDTEINEDEESRNGFSGPIGPDELNEGELIIELYDPEDEFFPSDVLEDDEK